MKIRECLVSNSSSSSFIVAFPKKPESAVEVIVMMRMELGETIGYYDDKAETGAVATRVFKDINKEATIEQISELISNRYCYTRHDGNTFGRHFNYGWVGKDKYYGNDEKLLAELAKLFVEEDEFREKHYKKEDKIVSKYGMHHPENYSELSQKEKDEWSKKYDEWVKINKEYIKCRSDYFKKSNEIQKKIYSLKDQNARIDAKKFMEDNAGKPIYIFEYSDNDGEFECAMEHGEIFGSLPHIVVSHH